MTRWYITQEVLFASLHRRAIGHDFQLYTIITVMDLNPNSIIASVSDVRQTLSSWDKCMQRGYCK